MSQPFVPVFDTDSLHRHDNTGKLAPGKVGASSSQRQWMSLSIQGDEVTIAPLDLPAAEIYMGSLDLEVGFWKRGLEITEQFSADEMANSFIKAFSGQIFGLDQQLVFDYHGQNLKAIVKGMSILQLAEGQQKRRAPPAAASGMGVLMDRSDVTFIKAADSRIKIRSSAKKCIFLVSQPHVSADHVPERPPMPSWHQTSNSKTWASVA